jgi:hypothetical protein
VPIDKRGKRLRRRERICRDVQNVIPVDAELPGLKVFELGHGLDRFLGGAREYDFSIHF